MSIPAMTFDERYSVIQSRDRAKFLNISVPVDDLTARGADCRDLSLTVVNRQSDLLGLLANYVHLLQPRSGKIAGAGLMRAGALARPRGNAPAAPLEELRIS